jgi:hypothetical protein
MDRRRHTNLQGALDVPGKFWLPERADDAISGRLSYDHGRIELELFGSFGRPLSQDDLPETDLILGYTEAGRCTLANCIRIGARSKILSGFDLAHSTWIATRLILGANFDRVEDINLSTVSIGFDALENWLADDPFDGSVESDSEGHPVTTVIHRYPESLAVALPGLDATLELDYRFRQNHESFHSFTWEHEAAFKIIPKGPKHLDWFFERLGDLRSLLTLLVGEAVTPTRLSGRLPDEERAEVSIFFAYTGEPPKRLVHPAQMLLTRGQLGERLPAIIRRWFEERDLLQTTVALLAGTLYTKDLPGEFRFLALTQALETFHRRTRSDRYLSAEKYVAVEEALRAAIPEGIPSDLRQALSDRLRYGNEHSQRRRLRDLLHSLDEAGQRTVSTDSKFVDRIIKERNYLTHYPEGEEPTMDGEELYYVSLRLRAMLVLLLLKVIGIEGNEAVEGLRRTRWSQMLLR